MNSDESPNPYASPQSPRDPAIETRIQSLKWLRGAALGIMIFAGFQIFAGVCWLIILPFQFAFELLFPGRVGIPAWMLALGWIASILVIVRAGYMMYGATHLRAAKNYRWARRSVILTMIGIFVPYFWWEVPFGIWAFLLLRQQKYKSLFQIGPAPNPAPLREAPRPPR